MVHTNNLPGLRSKLLENSAVSKTQKMKMFGSHNIKPLMALFNWSGRLPNQNKASSLSLGVVSGGGG
jgi:hypothetical protein